MNLYQIADRALNRPLLLHPDKAAIILDVLAGRIGVDGSGPGPLTPEASRFFGSEKRDDGSYKMNRAAGGVAAIPIVGSLVNRGAWIGASSGLVSYEGIAAQLREAAADQDVHTVVLDIDTGGGEAGGITSLVNQIVELRKTKRVVAVVNDMAASAGYWIASACDEIVVSETGIVGSIGVVVLHVNRSGELQQKGWQPTFIFAGAHKVDGNSLGPMPDEVRADVQASVDDLYKTFVNGVAANRAGRLTPKSVRATEARMFTGRAAVAAGLADRIASFPEVLAQFQADKRANKLGGSRSSGITLERAIRPAAAVSPPASAKLPDAHAQGSALMRGAVKRLNEKRSEI
ncbi:S49 family peptidase [Paracoccus aminophilus]|uniref:Peptidase S49 n=1 Tax=Paracoccus aminophilus JCM 7686 TaxID=1367847 RepID=S5YDE0_PARAH|nr:S49 family peptidase [Paracoccus aminophilus]AGT09468.1 peptidase S49 [Paracoccus aminophilus JCM 7686]